MTNNLIKYYVEVLVCALLVVSCSPKKSYEIKKIFFDGVPNPYVEDVFVLDSTNVVLLDSISAIKKPEIVYHQPFLEKKCNTCHQVYSRSQSSAKSKNLCYSCHDNLESEYKTMHAPVAAGYCTQCHDPHKSKFKGLLVEEHLVDGEKESLCFKCHDANKVNNYQIHTGIEEQTCTTCHNPHGGANKYILQSNACYECHDNFEDKYSNLHGPVEAGGLCFSCHDDHKSTSPKFLKIEGDKLCMNCHTQLDIFASEYHTQQPQQTCISCHNPHGSNRPLLLINKDLP